MDKDNKARALASARFTYGGGSLRLDVPEGSFSGVTIMSPKGSHSTEVMIHDEEVQRALYDALRTKFAPKSPPALPLRPTSSPRYLPKSDRPLAMPGAGPDHPVSLAQPLTPLRPFEPDPATPIGRALAAARRSP